MAACKKKVHPTKGDAIVFHQLRSRTPYRVYQCREHYPGWHITTMADLHVNVRAEIAALAKFSGPHQVTVGKISQNKKLHLVRHSKGLFLVRYHKRRQFVDVLYEVMPEDMPEDVLSVLRGIEYEPYDCLGEIERLLQEERNGKQG